MRKPIVAGNWKMNGSSEFASDMSAQINNFAKEFDNIDVVISPSSIYLQQAQRDAKYYACAAQNVHSSDSGAYTGEISVSMLQDISCRYVLVGHSERRAMFAETDTVVAAKVSACIKAALVPVLCVGESLEQRQSGDAFKVVKRQVLAALQGLSLTGVDVVIAYEPIWAIGTGETATPEQAQEMHAHIRRVLADEISAAAARSVRILYGGSVSAKTAEQLFAQPDIDGGLVGGASLKLEDFKTICSAAAGK